jgi:hypothetical protein
MKFELINELVVLEIEGRQYLVDTGAPLSFSLGKDLLLKLKNKEYLLKRIPLVDTFKKALDHILPEVQIDAVIGTDILVEPNLSINFLAREIYFDLVDFPYDIETMTLPLEYKLIHFFVKLLSDYGYLNLIVDSGSTMWYIKSKYLNLNDPDGEYEDYSPEIGKINGNYYEFYDGVHRECISVGELPKAYEYFTDGIMPLYKFSLPGHCQFNFQTGEFTITRRFL